MILFTNEKTLLSVVIPFKKVLSFHARFLESLELLSQSIAISPKDIHVELEEMKIVQLTQNTNRQTLGSMNDFVFHVKTALDRNRNATLQEISFDLSGIPCAPLKYGYPREAVLEIIDRPPHRGQFRRMP